MNSQPLQGKSALVTGGARRIGREIALSLASAGASVTITFRASRSEAEAVVLQIAEMGQRAQAVECDLRREASVHEAVRTAVEFHGGLEILVNNAAVFAAVPLEQITLEQWDAAFETNARGPFLMAREALPYLRAAHGRIVNIGSLGGIEAWAEHGHYCASKAALHSLTRSMAKAWAPEVSVNCVAPGWIEIGKEAEETARRFAARTPMKRNGSAADVAEAVMFFVSNSGFVTGEVLSVDGGLGL
jgi:3-oxoacyl-[acyl-carrier protein] reductase/pteridine reductase